MTYEEKLFELSQEDERIVVVTAENRAAIRSLPEKLRSRFIDVGIAEMTMIGVAAGLALRGRRPIVHSLATFLTARAYEFIRDDIGIPGLPVILVGGVPGFLSEANGPTHQAIDDIALMRSVPNMGIFCPSDNEELVDALPDLFASGRPYYVRYNQLASVRPHTQPFEPGKAEFYPSSKQTFFSDDAAILTYGFLLREALVAQKILAASGIFASVINMRTLSPLDKKAIVEASETADLLVTLEDHFRFGGLYSLVGELALDAGLALDVLPISLGTNWFKPLLLDDVLEYEKFSGEWIAQRIKSRLEEKIAAGSENTDLTNEQFYTLN